jgi:hypothetical protein
MTLTSQVGVDQRDHVLATLQKALRRTCKQRALAIERISLVRQNDENTQFRVIEQATLRAPR